MWVQIKNNIMDGIANFPWRLIQLTTLAIVIYVISGNRIGNAVRCYVFDSDGCKPKIEIEICSDESQPKDPHTDPSRSTSNRKIIQHRIELTNFGIGSVKTANLSFIYPESGDGIYQHWPSVSGYMNNNFPIMSSNFYRTNSIFSTERFTLNVRSAIKSRNETVRLVIEVDCAGCQIPFYLHRFESNLEGASTCNTSSLQYIREFWSRHF